MINALTPQCPPPFLPHPFRASGRRPGAVGSGLRGTDLLVQAHSQSGRGASPQRPLPKTVAAKNVARAAPRRATCALPWAVARLLPWSPCAHPGPWERSIDARQENSVYHELIEYVEALRPAPTWRIFSSIDWRRDVRQLLKKYIESERYLQRDLTSPYFQRTAQRNLEKLSRTLPRFASAYAGHPRYPEVQPLIARVSFGIRLRGRELGMEWDSKQQILLAPSDSRQR
jgi:hypothetical protein